MKDHRVERLIGKGQGGKVTLDQIKPIGGQVLQAGAGEAEHFRAFVEAGDMAGATRQQFSDPARTGADVEQSTQADLAQRAEQRGLDRTIRRMQPAQFVPFRRVTGEIGLGRTLPRGADRGEVAAVFGAAGRKLGIVLFGHGKQPCRRSTQRRGAVFADGAAQEHPGPFLAPFGEAGIAQDLDMARDTWLALPQNQRQFAHGKLHRREQAHDAQARWISQGTQGRFNPHGGAYKEIFICDQPVIA